MDSSTYKLSIPNKEENLSLVRLTASFVACKMNFDLESIEDIKVSISEACNFQLGLSEEFLIEITNRENLLDIRVKNDTIEDMTKLESRLSDISIQILNSLMDEFEFTKEEMRLIKELR